MINSIASSTLALSVAMGFELFRVATHKMEDFKSYIVAQNRRAKRFGSELITYSVVSEKDEQFKVEGPHGEQVTFTINITTVKVSGPRPKINGWELIGVLDHAAVPGTVIMKSIPGQEIPSQYRDSHGNCDHCGHNRARNETFVLKNDNGSYMEVGRTCLQDFLNQGFNTSMFDFAISWHSDMSEELESYSGGKQDYNADKIDVLVYSFASIKMYGFQKSDGNYPTKVHVAQEIFGWNKEPNKEFYDHLKANRPDYEKKAQEAIAWLENQPVNGSEYIYNLQALNSQPGIPERMFGYWVSLASTYNRYLEKQVETAPTTYSSHLGTVGGKITADVTIKSLRSVEGRYGTTDVVGMIDANGNVLTWFSTGAGSRNIEVGNKFRMTGTVKQHTVYNGVNQTLVTRAKLI